MEAKVSPAEDELPPCGPVRYGNAVCATQAKELPQARASEIDYECERSSVQWHLLDEALGLGRASSTPQVLFPQLNWASVEKAHTLAKVKAMPTVKTLVKIFEDTGFTPSVNFMVGLGLSLTVPMFGMGVSRQWTARDAVIGTMLAAMPEQAGLERVFSQLGGAADNSNDLLANRCLETFAQQTGVGIWQRTIDVRTKTMKLSFAAYDDLFGTQRKLLKYSPAYIELMGFSDSASYLSLSNSSSEALKEALDSAREQLVSDMLSHFWREVDAYPYATAPALRRKLGEDLHSYIAAGLHDQSSSFLPPPDTHFSFFLFGGAGTGKSTMVTAFSRALQATLKHFVDSKRRVDVVKVPLNGLNSESLAMILRVQGISDMSIERLVEQTIQRGDIAILHLEEIPEDPFLQETLVSTIKSMLAALQRRYHMYAGNVILSYTSNYRAAPSIASSTNEITVETPSAEGQSRHCIQMLQRCLHEATKARDVSVTLKYKLPLIADMRPLYQWWTTISYHIEKRVQALTACHGVEHPPRAIAAILSSSNGGSLVDVHLDIEFSDVSEESSTASGSPTLGHVCTEPALGVGIGFGSDLLHEHPHPLKPSLSHSKTDLDQVCDYDALASPNSDGSGSQQWSWADGDSFSSPATARSRLTLSSMDGFFFVDGDVTSWEPKGSVVEMFRRRQSATVLKMCLTGALKPGVIVLTGNDQSRSVVESDVLEQAGSMAGSVTAQVVRVHLREESDKDKVNGHQSQIRGGLFKVIDDFNNPNSTTAVQDGLLVVVCYVNETGQYMLRELLETNGESKTHRYAIRKDRVVFVLSVDQDAGLQDMTISRAHYLLHCV